MDKAKQALIDDNAEICGKILKSELFILTFCCKINFLIKKKIDSCQNYGE